MIPVTESYYCDHINVRVIRGINIRDGGYLWAITLR